MSDPRLLRGILLLGYLLLSGTATRAEGADCADGIALDDGSFENAYTLSSTTAEQMVMRFDLPPGSAVERVCFCWIRQGVEADLSFDIVFFRADGPGGLPGTVLGSVAANAPGVPTRPPGEFFGFDVSQAGIIVPPEGLYVGARWDPESHPSFFLCADLDGPASPPIYVSQNGGASWRDLRFDAPPLQALAIRLEIAEPAPLCAPSATSLCLNGGRYRVSVRWFDGDGNQGDGRAVEQVADDSGLFWFFEPDNWEMLVKVLDGCAINNRVWVYAAATTDRGYVLTVTDTETQASVEYRNPPHTPAAAITDSNALPTCPASPR